MNETILKIFFTYLPISLVSGLVAGGLGYETLGTLLALPPALITGVGILYIMFHEIWEMWAN